MATILYAQQNGSYPINEGANAHKQKNKHKIAPTTQVQR